LDSSLGWKQDITGCDRCDRLEPLAVDSDTILKVMDFLADLVIIAGGFLALLTPEGRGLLKKLLKSLFTLEEVEKAEPPA